jgi:hypothetical protein
MAFKINKITGSDVQTIASRIRLALSQSRFNADVSTPSSRCVEIRTVRQNEKKDYCGHHPFACPVRPGPHKPHKHLPFLEGADWVAFNDMLNDCLDSLNVSANAGSSLCIIRKGYLRRAEYSGHTLGNGIDSEWNRDSSVYVRGRDLKAPKPSEYPLDTPGLDYWQRSGEDSRPAKLREHDHAH